jgi:hypothetical protein
LAGVTNRDEIAGAGKTKLVSKVIDDLTSRPLDVAEARAYFYCDRNQEPYRKPENILRSFVKQLSIPSTDEDGIHSCLVELYNQKSRDGFASERIDLVESEALLLQLIQTYSRTTLVLDALDECHDDSRVKIIELFDRLLKSSKSLKIFISSRRDDNIKWRLEKKTNIGIEATDNHSDISKFVAEAIREDQKKRRNQIPADLQQEIIDTLLVKSNGM